MGLVECKDGKRFTFPIPSISTIYFRRKNMEDTHLTELDIAPDMSVFGVFDGHGGKKHSMHHLFITQFISDSNIQIIRSGSGNIRSGALC